MKTFFNFFLLFSGNTVLYFVFFWIVGDAAGKRPGFGNEILHALRFTVIAAPMILAGSFLINWAILRESPGANFLVTIVLMWLANPIALFAAMYFTKQKIEINIYSGAAFILMLLAQLLMRLPR